MLAKTNHPLTKQSTATEMNKMTQEDIESMEEFTEADFKEIRAILAKDQGQQ
jgi:hypothetical protein